MQNSNYKTFLLCLNKKNVNLPADILEKVYFYQLKSCDKKFRIQIEMSFNSRNALEQMENISNLWFQSRLFSFEEFLFNNLSNEERVYLWKKLMNCQCCKRHYGSSFQFYEKFCGEPYFIGKKDKNAINTNYKFKRHGKCCQCKCRHFRRWLARSFTINEEMTVLDDMPQLFD